MNLDGRSRSEPVEEIIAALERELRQRPSLRLGVLQEFAANIDPAIATLDPRQFHAEYVLPAQRRITRSRTVRRPRRSTQPVAPPAQQPQGGRVLPATPSPFLEAEPAAPAPRRSPARRAPEAPPPRPARRPSRAAPAPIERVTAAPVERAAPGAINRAALRTAFLEWAHVLAEAESSTELVTALSKVDGFVERALVSLGGSEKGMTR